jgi:hypothetical protein
MVEWLDDEFREDSCWQELSKTLEIQENDLVTGWNSDDVSPKC